MVGHFRRMERYGYDVYGEIVSDGRTRDTLFFRYGLQMADTGITYFSQMGGILDL